MKNKTRNLKFYLLNKVVLNIAAALETWSITKLIFSVNAI